MKIFFLYLDTLSYLILIYLSSWCDISKDFTDLTNVDVNRHFLKTLRHRINGL